MNIHLAENIITSLVDLDANSTDQTAQSTFAVLEPQLDKELVEKPSKVKRNIKFAWHGIEQVLQKTEKFLDGTPFKTPIAVLNTLIDIANAR